MFTGTAKEKIWLRPCESQSVSDSPLVTDGRKLWQLWLAQLCWPEGWGSETQPTPVFFNPLSLDPVPLSIPKPIQLDTGYYWSEFSWLIFTRSSSSLVSSFCRNLGLCLKLSLLLQQVFPNLNPFFLQGKSIDPWPFPLDMEVYVPFSLI